MPTSKWRKDTTQTSSRTPTHLRHADYKQRASKEFIIPSGGRKGSGPAIRWAVVSLVKASGTALNAFDLLKTACNNKHLSEHRNKAPTFHSSVSLIEKKLIWQALRPLLPSFILEGYSVYFHSYHHVQIVMGGHVGQNKKQTLKLDQGTPYFLPADSMTLF